MEKKDERPSNRVPAGTFGASDPPPARRSDPGTRSAALADGVTPASEPPAPPSRDSDPDAADRKRYTSTLMGHGTPPGTDGVPPPVAPVLAPPKWRGAKAYLEGQEPKPRVSTIAASAPIVDAELAASATPAGTRVNTKLGTPPAPPVPAPMPQGPSLRDISDPAIDQAIERMLEGQTSVPMEVETADPDLDALEELPIEEVVDEPSERAVPLARVALKTAAARVPVAGPIEARVREQAGDHRVDAVPAAPITSAPPPPAAPMFDVELGAPAPPSIDLATPPAGVLAEPAAPAKASAAERTGERAPRSAEGEPAQYGASDTPSALAELRTRRNSDPAQPAENRSPAKAAPAASPGLAAATSGRVARSPRSEQHLAFGSGLLAVMLLFGFGGWYLTRGGFHRSVAPASALAEPTAVPKPEPLVPVVPKGLVQPAPAMPATPPPATAPSTTLAQPAHDSHEAHAHGRDSHGSDSHASDGHAGVRRDSEPPRPSQDSAQPPVLRVVPQGTKPASEGPSETPTRAEVLAALEPLRPAVARCVQGQHGIAQLDITVINTGVVTHAVVAGDFAGTPEGSCIALAARDAKFAPFQKPRFRVIFPFSL
jgi:hypothetical protein